MIEQDAVTARSLAVLARYWMCMRFAGRQDLGELLEFAYPDDYAKLREASAGQSSEGLGNPLVLFASQIESPEVSAYQRQMQKLDVASRVALLKLDLRDLPRLAAKGFLTREQADAFRKVTTDTLSTSTAFDFVCFLNDLALVRHISETTASCYRRWIGSHLESVGLPDARVIREWVIPYSRKFFTMAFGFIEHQKGGDGDGDVGDQDLMVGSFTLSGLRQLDLFESPTATDGETALEGMTEFYEAHQGDKDLATARKKTSEYSYISGSVLPVLLGELAAMKRCGKTPKYKYGQITATMFMGSLFTGLRHSEWFEAVLHEDGFTDTAVTNITLNVPVLQVFSVKQGNRRHDNPLRDYRLLVLEDFEPEYIVMIRNTLAVVQSMAREQDRTTVAKNIRMQLNRVWRRLERDGLIKETNQQSDGVTHNSVSMHTARKTFAEEVRRSQEYTRFELASMLGHTNLMNLRYYAKVKKILPRSHTYRLPKPWPGDAYSLEEWNAEVTGYMKSDRLGEQMQKIAAGVGGRSASEDWYDTQEY